MAERERFEQMYRHEVDAVLAYALARTDPDTARDVVAETFLVAWRRWPVPDPARPWLFGVARRALAGQRRSARRQRAVAERLVTTREPARYEPADPADEVADRAAARSALARLRPADREVLCLVTWDGLSPDDAARALGCTRVGFAVRLHRARARYEAALAAEDAHLAARKDSPRVVAVEP